MDRVRTSIIGFKVRESERRELDRLAAERGASGISDLVRHALDAFLGTNLAEGNMNFAADRPRRRCRECRRVTTHLYGDEQVCGRCFREAHPEIRHGGRLTTRERCRKCSQPSAKLYGEEMACAKCYREAHPEIPEGPRGSAALGAVRCDT